MNKSSVWFKRAVFLALFLLISSVCPLKALAYVIVPQNDLDQSLYYLYQSQTYDGGLTDKNLTTSQDLESAWGAIAFASEGYDPATVQHTNSDPLIKFIESKACSYTSITDIERTILVVVAANLDPTNFGGCDLTAKISTDPATGKIGPDLMSTIYGVYAYYDLGWAIDQKTIDYLKTSQQADGGWDPLGWGEDSNTTAQALVALLDAGVSKFDLGIQNARQFLKNLQTESGGIKYDGNTWTTDQDAFSDAYSLQAIFALHEKPTDTFWLNGGKSIINGLNLLRQDNGSYFFSADPTWGDSTPVWTTSIVVLGLSGQLFPICGLYLDIYDRAETLPSQQVDDPPVTPPVTSPIITATVTVIPSATTAPVTTATVAATTTSRIGTTNTANIIQEPAVSGIDTLPTKAIDLGTLSEPKVLGETAGSGGINWLLIIILILCGLGTGFLIARVYRIRK